MNHPRHAVVDELRWIAAAQLDFVDLTLEPPAAAVWRLDLDAVAAVLAETGLEVVGHTAYYLPIASPFAALRRAAVDELRRCLDAFARLGARWMNVHPDRYAPMHDRAFFVERDVESLAVLLRHGREVGVGVMVENIPGDFNTADQLGELLGPLPELRLHLDIGHANLLVPANTTTSILERFGGRLAHVHLHDNKGGGADLHLPLGAGEIDVAAALGAVRATGYDGTITLEVFAADRHHLEYSRDVLRRLWDG